MKVQFAPSFEKDIKGLRDSTLKSRLAKAIERFEAAADLSAVPQIKALSGNSSCYRCRIGDYRLGFEFDGERILLLRFLHRKDIYHRFPPS